MHCKAHLPMLFAIIFSLLFISPSKASQQQLFLDERYAEPGEWGYRPDDGAVSKVNPPSFVWRPQKNLSWELECTRDSQFKDIDYQATNIEFNVHYPHLSFKPGIYSWRYRGKDEKGDYTNWSKPRTFTIARDAVVMPLPRREELISRVPQTHPRLFMRPENLERLKELSQGKMKAEYDKLVKNCDRIMANPPPTEEPPKYPEDMNRFSDEWSKIWWGNREYTIEVLNGAATLAFTRLLGGQKRYGLEAKRILLECAKWDPNGSTGYRYNDEAGMPYAYYFARTYTFINDLLSEEEKQICRDVMKFRGNDMYQHLCPRHLWQPYSSHSNRAWHFLGEVGIAFLDEIEEANDWVWFAANVFFNVYPVWSDEDGGWHEGSSYWASYLERFTYWADVMYEAMGINAYDKPFFSNAGYYAMYLMPPGMSDGGFGDLTENRKASSNVPLMSVLAAQAQNGYWQWYVKQLGGPVTSEGYIGFIRGMLPEVRAKSPDDLPTSHLFEGTGQAYLNSNITDASNSVQVVFKSSPFGTQSHGYEANNSFLLWAYGKRLLIRTGRRDIYGSDHHKNWMWSTRSVNNITVNGQGQISHSAKAQGKITAFKTTPSIDIVVGEANQSYDPPLERFTRAIIFVKPELVIVYDRLEVKELSNYEYWLHAINKINIQNQHNIQVQSDDAICDIDFLTPANLTFELTDQYDPNPQPHIKVREWHLTAKTSEKNTQTEFVTLYRPHRIETQLPKEARLETIEGGYTLEVELSDGKLTALLPTDDQVILKGHGIESKGVIKCQLNRAGKPIEAIELE